LTKLQFPQSNSCSEDPWLIKPNLLLYAFHFQKFPVIIVYVFVVNFLIFTVKKKNLELYRKNIAIVSHKSVRCIWMGN